MAKVSGEFVRVRSAGLKQQRFTWQASCLVDSSACQVPTEESTQVTVFVRLRTFPIIQITFPVTKMSFLNDGVYPRVSICTQYYFFNNIQTDIKLLDLSPKVR